MIFYLRSDKYRKQQKAYTKQKISHGFGGWLMILSTNNEEFENYHVKGMTKALDAVVKEFHKEELSNRIFMKGINHLMTGDPLMILDHGQY